jgi:hypothetical protein
VTHICRLFTDKSCIKVLQKASQNTRHKIVKPFKARFEKKNLNLSTNLIHKYGGLTQNLLIYFKVKFNLQIFVRFLL